MPSGTVGIVTRTKDRPLMLGRALKSVLSQTFEDWALVVVNDGGEPGPVHQALEPFRSALADRCQLISLEASGGMEAASNRAIANLPCKYLVIHDDDDSWEPEFLQATVEFMEGERPKNTKGVMTHSHLVEERIDNGKIHFLKKCPHNDWIRDINFFEMLADNCFPPISFLFARDAYEKVGPFNEELPVLGDWEFNVRFLRHFDIGVIPQSLANYHHRRNDRSSAYGNSVHAQRDRLKYYDNQLRNRWLREDLEAGRFGLGAAAGLARSQWKIRRLLKKSQRSIWSRLFNT